MNDNTVMCANIAQQIVKRIRAHMDAIFLTMGGILIPLGFWLKVEQPQLDNLGTVSVLIGLVLWLLAYFTVKNKEKRERVEKQEERQKSFESLTGLLTDIRQELHELNQESKK